MVRLPEAGTYRLTTYGQEDGKLFPASVHRIVRKIEEKVITRDKYFPNFELITKSSRYTFHCHSFIVVIFCLFIFKPEEEEPDHGEFKIVGRKICLVLAHTNHANIIHLFHLPCQDKLMFCIYCQLSCNGFQLLSMCEKVTPLTMNEIFECSAYKFPRQTNNLWKF